jgi:DNA mismatch repair protein MutL
VTPEIRAMGIINQLPPSVINQIASGEVVERPASVVKELLENAIDAGATRIDVTVERGGKDLIRVADNGSGIGPDDLPLAFLPHATSKLTSTEDLARIRTLGFRGEALAAIAEVSRVRCASRQADSDEGYELAIDAGVAAPVVPTGCPVGTVVEVRNLFYNTPVRRAYLKSDSTEAGHVLETFERIALAHPTVHLTFRSGGKLVHELLPVTGVRERVSVFLGRELAESLLWVESRVGATHLWGYVAHPSQSRSSPKSQYLYVASRFVRDRSLGHALAEAYRGLLMVGRYPIAFLHLEIPPDEVDVNVHPTKIEVRFRDSQRIYSQLLASVRQTFLSSDLHSRLQAAEAFPEPPATGPSSPTGAGAPQHSAAPTERRAEISSWFQPGSPSTPAPDFRAYPNPGYAGGKPATDWSVTLTSPPQSAQNTLFDEFAPSTPSGASTPEPESVPLAGAAPSPIPLNGLGVLKAIQVHDSYLIAETDDGMMVIDQHALHERILYEELRNRVEQGRVESQGLLVPEPVHLSPAEAAAVLEHAETLGRLGLGLEPFGGDTILVTSLPAMLRDVVPDRLVRDLAEHLRTKALPPTRDGLLADLLHMIACKAAVKAGQKLSAEEVAALLERRQLVTDSHHCPHGRPTALIFTKSELEKQFGRI